MYTVGEVSGTLRITKDTLRYYDKIGLLQPRRAENGYRCYTDADLIDLKYIEVMKYAGLTLSDIKKILGNKAGKMEEDKQITIHLLRKKQKDLAQAISLYRTLMQMIEEAVRTIEKKHHTSDMQETNKLVTEIFENILSKEDTR